MQPTTPLLSRAARKLKLTSKQAGPNYYKGYGSGAMGRHTKHGGYVIEWHKVRTFVVPTIRDDFYMTPFVSKRIDKPKNMYAVTSAGDADGKAKTERDQGPLSGWRFLEECRRVKMEKRRR